MKCCWSTLRWENIEANGMDIWVFVCVCANVFQLFISHSQNCVSANAAQTCGCRFFLAAFAHAFIWESFLTYIFHNISVDRCEKLNWMQKQQQQQQSTWKRSWINWKNENQRRKKFAFEIDISRYIHPSLSAYVLYVRLELKLRR